MASLMLLFQESVENLCLMRPALLTPMRLLSGIAALTILCMFAVAIVADHLADICLSTSPFGGSSRIHLIADVNHALTRAQDCRSAYLATGNASYLDAYRAASADVDFSMDRLVNEDSEVTNNLAHAQGLRQFVHAKLSEIGRTLESKPTAQAPVSMPAVDNDIGRIQNLLDSLSQEESRDVSGQLEAAAARSAFHRKLVIALAVINVLFLGGVAFCAIQIGKLHSLITMCAWSKRVQYQDKWVPLEEYVSNRFGVRISHGISQEEYDKWTGPPTPGEPPPGDASSPKSRPVQARSPQAAA
jgi:CHASE3 domain sensor protein